ncbi:transcription initiation factor IIF, beta subunit-domain-containing protein [Scenedesmus sp. NREL 46B-D3]|nr:transcription initiation factor IIF, beta subunit-domain-containing protein [Scenedesmus sp. NREL 46B-D3]
MSYDPTAAAAAAAAAPPPPPAAGPGAGAAKAAAAAVAGGIDSVQLPRVDGVVHKRYDAAPIKIADVPQSEMNAPLSGLNLDQVKREAEQRQRAAAAMQGDATYLQNSRKRLAAAARPSKPHKLAMLTNLSEMKQLAGGTQSLPVYQKKREAKTAVAEVKRRVRMSKDELEAELFKKFAEQPHWHFVQLQKEVDQPVSYLKEVLNEVASQIKRGPNKDLWELKKHLVTGSTTPQQPRQE